MSDKLIPIGEALSNNVNFKHFKIDKCYYTIKSIEDEFIWAFSHLTEWDLHFPKSTLCIPVSEEDIDKSISQYGSESNPNKRILAEASGAAVRESVFSKKQKTTKSSTVTKTENSNPEKLKGSHEKPNKSIAVYLEFFKTPHKKSEFEKAFNLHPSSGYTLITLKLVRELKYLVKDSDGRLSLTAEGLKELSSPS